MRISLIGCGLVGSKRALAIPPGAEIGTLYDVEGARAEALAARLGAASVVPTVKELLADEPDLVIVATVHRDLADLAGQALEAGCNVLIEKPGACRARELRQVRRVAQAGDRVVRVGFNHRFHPAMMHARDILTSTDGGPLIYVRGRYGHGGRVGYENEWRADPHLSCGGELLDQGIHLIDLTRYLEGDVELAFAELASAFWPTPVEDNAFLCLRIQNGGTAWLHASWTEWKNLFSLEVVHHRFKLEATGLGGSYGVERLSHYQMRPEMGPPDRTAWEWPQPDDSWGAELRDVMAAVGGVPGCGATVDDAIAALDVVEEAYAR